VSNSFVVNLIRHSTTINYQYKQCGHSFGAKNQGLFKELQLTFLDLFWRCFSKLF